MKDYVPSCGLEKTIMQGMVAGKRSQDKDGRKASRTDTFGTVAAASRLAEDKHRFRRDIWAVMS